MSLALEYTLSRPDLFITNRNKGNGLRGVPQLRTYPPHHITISTVQLVSALLIHGTSS